MADTWLESVPYGGFVGGTPESQALVGQAAQHPAVTEGETTIALLGGLALITGGAAAVGWFLAAPAAKLTGALIGAVLGLGYSAANLAVNASAIATDNAQLSDAAARAQAAAGRTPAGGTPR